MPKLILSRKGFDSSAGHGYSPYDPETGRYIVLPIPEMSGRKGGYTYSQLPLKPGYMNGETKAGNLRELIHDPVLNYSKKTRDVVDKHPAHYDPVTGRPPWDPSGPDYGAFGQSDAAAGHLRNHNVREGSVFLFFSRFKPVSQHLHPLDPRLAWNDGAYFLYGWLKVGKVYTASNQDELPEEIRRTHPHGSQSDFENRQNNIIFTASDRLFEDSEIPGTGMFPKLTDELLLSSEAHRSRPTIWKLPSFFQEERYCPTYLNAPKTLKDRWFHCTDDQNYCYVQSTARGQEYVSPLEGKSEVWLRELFQKVNL
ncbi:hypothetical protein CR205_13625 [Alteribacter lacisalsi]|uniref:Nucleotide modification associated domain-containing protein n=1 Tax=Alteribacter lacisalsi TaxID=2045244 RepID=A0A2W0H7L6_9BACI|nr:hypothetical protein [Alteribacter lacisalsi]PYZ96726.1 hypothetical protein CR205_13625 [Alteribacter lacisalsi]